jgi:hypothetical protein
MEILYELQVMWGAQIYWTLNCDGMLKKPDQRNDSNPLYQKRLLHSATAQLLLLTYRRQEGNKLHRIAKYESVIQYINSATLQFNCNTGNWNVFCIPTVRHTVAQQINQAHGNTADKWGTQLHKMLKKNKRCTYIKASPIKRQKEYNKGEINTT